MTHHRDFDQTGNRGASSQHHVLVVGGGTVGLAVADHLAAANTVTFAGETSRNHTDHGDVSVISEVPTDAADVQALRDGLGAVDVVATIGSDSESLFLGYLCERAFEPAATVATLEDPDRRAVYHQTGIEPVPVPELLAEHVSSYVEDVEIAESVHERA